jgi:formylglycine-generating enzyme required for sulfatase activity
LGYQYAVYGDDEGDCSYPSGTFAQCGVSWATNISPVGTAVLGVGRWGQLDLLGNVRESTLDTYAQFVDPCVDCAYLSPTGGEVLRGCASDEPVTALNSAARQGNVPTGRDPGFGFRCARTP